MIVLLECGFDDAYYIFINENLSPQEQWQDFGMYHFCVPTFLLLDMNISNYFNIEDGIDIVASTFNVTTDFARKRLEMCRNQVMQAKADEEHRKYMESRYPKAPPYSEETNKILERALKYKTKKIQKE